MESNSKTKAFIFRITPELYEWLDRQAWNDKISKAAYITKLLEQDRKQKESERCDIQTYV